MISINLLPWRKLILIKKRRNLLYQLLAATLFPALAVTAYCMIETHRLSNRVHSMEAYRSANQRVLTKIERIDSVIQDSSKQQSKHRQMVRIIHLRNRLPGILEMLTSQKRNGRINKLVLDEHSLKISYFTDQLDDTLALFQLLNSYPLLCDVSFDPVGMPSEQNKTAAGASRYELNAKLCDNALY